MYALHCTALLSRLSYCFLILRRFDDAQTLAVQPAAPVAVFVFVHYVVILVAIMHDSKRLFGLPSTTETPYCCHSTLVCTVVCICRGRPGPICMVLQQPWVGVGGYL